MNEWRTPESAKPSGGCLRFRTISSWYLLLCCTLLASHAFGQKPSGLETSADSTHRQADAAADSAVPAEIPAVPTLALVGAQIHTLGGQGVINNGVVLLTGDVISKVGGRDLEIPASVETLDVTGLVLTPGLIDASSRLWLTSAAANSTASDASLNVLDGVDNYSDQWQEVVRHGVTTVFVQPDRGGTLGGYGAVLSTVPGDAGPTVLSKYAALQASIGTGAANNRARFKQFESTKKAFADAAAYQKKWDEYHEHLRKKEAAKSGEKPEVKTGDAVKEKPPLKPKQDDAKERLAKVVNGQIPLRLEIHTADDAHYALELLKEFTKLQVVLAGVSDLRSATQSIRELSTPVVLGPWLAAEPNYRDDPDSKRVWAEAFHDYGGALVIASAGTADRSSRLLRAHVGQAIAAGIDAQAALLAVTLNAARALGVDDQIGSVEAGKRADLVCFRGHPTNASATVAIVIAAGKVVHQAAATDESNAQFVASTVSNNVAELIRVDASKLAIRTKHFLQPDGTTAPRTVVIDTTQGTVISLDPIDARVDSGIQVVDVGSAWVTPGLFAAHATLGLNRLVDPQLSDATNVVAADAITAGFEGESERVKEGMLRALLSPGGSNTLAGQASVIRLGARDPVLVRDATMKFNLTASARSAERFPASLAGQLQLIKESLAGQLLDTRLYLPQSVQKRLAEQRSEKLTSVASGKTWTLLAVTSDADIRGALDLVEHQKMQAALVGAGQLAPFVERIKALNVSVIARPVGVSDYNWYPQDLANTARGGVDIFFAGETAEQLRLTAAMATEAGMASASALASLCFGPERLFPKNNFQAADLVVWSASPLDLRAKPLCVIVDGQVVSTELEQRGSDEN